MQNSEAFEVVLERLLSVAREHENYMKVSKTCPTMKHRAESIREDLERLSTIAAENHHMQIYLNREKLQGDLEYLQYVHKEQAEIITRLRFDLDKKMGCLCETQKELTETKKDLSETIKRLSVTNEQLSNMAQENMRFTHGALRRQIAINIEYEIKLELLIKLQECTDEYNVQNSDLFTLRRRVLEADEGFSLKAGTKLDNSQLWEQFCCAMRYLKAFSFDAHPTKLNGHNISVQDATMLIDEEFDISSVRRQRLDWNSLLRNVAKHYVTALAQHYRNPEESLLYN